MEQPDVELHRIFVCALLRALCWLGSCNGILRACYFIDITHSISVTKLRWVSQEEVKKSTVFQLPYPVRANFGGEPP